jgi:ankyrin repeat protein
LNWAALRNDSAMIELLLDAGAEINATNLTRLSALHHAVEAIANDAVKLLLAKGADLELRNSYEDRLGCLPHQRFSGRTSSCHGSALTRRIPSPRPNLPHLLLLVGQTVSALRTKTGLRAGR